jgi:hypothetical protein
MSMDLTRWAYGVQDKAVNTTAKAVLVNICFHANHDSGKCELKFSTVMRECGLSKSAVTKAVKRLDDAGYLNRERLSYYDSKLRCYSFTVNREVVPRTTSTETVEVVPATNRGRTSSNSRSYEVRHKNPKDEPKAKPTTNVSSGSYVADKDLSTSTTGGAGAVEEEPFDNHVSQKENPEHDLQPLPAKPETPKSQDEAESNGSGKEGGARSLQDDLPAEMQALVASFPTLRMELVMTWRRHLDGDVSNEAMARMRRYGGYRVGKGLPRPLKRYEAEAKAFPDHTPGAARSMW